MNNVFVYCEIEGTTVMEVSQELLTKGRKLANQLGVELHAVVAGTGITCLMVLINSSCLMLKVCSLTLLLLTQTFWSIFSKRKNLRFV